MKHYHFYNLTQFLQGVVVPCGYMSQILYAIFCTKLDIDNWEGNVNYIRAWLYIECTFFLSWIMCAMIFLFFAYVFKFKSVSKSEEVMQMDDNVWNDKDTDDFLRYLKFEFFVLNYMMTFLLTSLTVGLGVMSGPAHALLAIFGDNDSNTAFEIFGIICSCRAMHLIVTAYRFNKG